MTFYILSNSKKEKEQFKVIYQMINSQIKHSLEDTFTKAQFLTTKTFKSKNYL